jgi:hypothetical protein
MAGSSRTCTRPDNGNVEVTEKSCSLFRREREKREIRRDILPRSFAFWSHLHEAPAPGVFGRCFFQMFLSFWRENKSAGSLAASLGFRH